MANMVKVENVVASTSLGMKFDLEIITNALDKVEYEPEQFPGLVYHIDEPKAAALIFGSGKSVCEQPSASGRPANGTTAPCCAG